MKVRLLFADRPFDAAAPAVFGAQDYAKDLELEPILWTMSGQDPIILQSAQAVLANPLTSQDAVLYRQRVLSDCLKNPDAVRRLYEISCKALEGRQKGDWWDSSDFAPGVFASAVELLTGFLAHLRALREIAQKNRSAFCSEGFTSLFDEILSEVDSAFLKEAARLLEDLQFKGGIVVGMRLGEDSRTENYTLLRQDPQKSWLKWKLAASYTPNEWDYNAIRDLNNRRDRAMTASVRVLVGAATHITDFFAALQGELAFYVGALSLKEALDRKGVPVCLPEFCPKGSLRRSFEDLRDMSLCLTAAGPVVPVSLSFENKPLLVITGANKGGKTTFLRSLGQSQLLAQSGLFTAAKSCTLPLVSGLFTHFCREEDSELASGKLDEELRRMDAIVDHLTPGSLVLFNESFASTNEREGSALCRQIARSFIKNGMEAVFVTHQFAFARLCQTEDPSHTLFLRAPRLSDGSRSFVIEEGEPLQTAFGSDLYHQIFG